MSNIYSDIHSYKFFFMNIFGHSFVPNLFVRIYSDFRPWVCESVKTRQIFEYIRIFVQFSIQIFIRTFVRVKFLIWIYADISSCELFVANIFGYSFVLKFSRMSHSDMKAEILICHVLSLTPPGETQDQDSGTTKDCQQRLCWQSLVVPESWSWSWTVPLETTVNL